MKRALSCPCRLLSLGLQIRCTRNIQSDRRNAMNWETPSAADMRFGFEITMYIASR
jgi:coenzyme PQQ precursor peptide PqqA